MLPSRASHRNGTVMPRSRTTHSPVALKLAGRRGGRGAAEAGVAVSARVAATASDTAHRRERAVMTAGSTAGCEYLRGAPLERGVDRHRRAQQRRGLVG